MERLARYHWLLLCLWMVIVRSDGAYFPFRSNHTAQTNETSVLAKAFLPLLAKFWFPGVVPEVYNTHETVQIFSDVATSVYTNIPVRVSDIPGCPLPSGERHLRRISDQSMNIGERLQGVDRKPSPYSLLWGRSLPCVLTCPGITNGTALFFNENQVEFLRQMIDLEYRVHLSLDQLSVMRRGYLDPKFVYRGYPIGYKIMPSATESAITKYYLYNHLKFIITVYRIPDAENAFHITGFEVIPSSFRHALDGSTCPHKMEDDDFQEESEDQVDAYLALHAWVPVIYSYAVEWKASKMEWSDRWDIYMINHKGNNIPLFSIYNSLVIVLFLSVAIAATLRRMLRKDINTYNKLALEENPKLEKHVGWKLLQGDVFRSPSYQPMLLSVLVGIGAQLATVSFLTALMIFLKAANPIHKGRVLTIVIYLYVITGSVSGYVSARISKFCGLKSFCKRQIILTASFLPGLLVGIFILLNACLYANEGRTTLSFGLLVYIFLLWGGVSAPLVYLGAYFGYQADKLPVPVPANDVARMIPAQPWYRSRLAMFATVGILPFACVMIEFFYILTALWYHYIYNVMGFLLAIWLILVVTCAEVSIVVNYLQLCAEDHRWWWKAFGSCASAGLYMFLYSLLFLVRRLHLVGVLPVVIYLSYMFLISLCFGLLCGSIGFCSAFWFNRYIYGALKVGFQ